jgi:hypothetical protein
MCIVSPFVQMRRCSRGYLPSRFVASLLAVYLGCGFKYELSIDNKLKDPPKKLKPKLGNWDYSA